MSTDEANDDLVEIRFNPTFAWMLIIFSGIAVCLGSLFMLPFMAGRNVLLGFGIIALAAAGLAVGFWWKKHLPVQLRLTLDELQFCDKRPPILWTEIERVDLKKIHVNGEVGFACLKLKPEAAQKAKAQKSFLHKFAAKLSGDYEVMLHEQQFDKNAEWLVTEFNRRISLAVARQRGLTSGNMRQANAAPETSRKPAAVLFSSPSGTATPLWLGPRQAEYGVSHRGRNKAIFVAILLFVAGGFCFAAPFLRKPKPGEEGAVFSVLYVLGSLSCLSGLAFLSSPLFRKRQTFAVHQEGLAVRQGGLTLHCRWQDIERLSQRVEKGTVGEWLVDAIQIRGGKKIEVDPNHVQNADELMRAVGSAAGEYLAPPIASNLLGGETLMIGPLVLTADVVQVGQFTCPWNSVQAIETAPEARALIAIYTDQGPIPFRFGMSSIPNLRVLNSVAKLMNTNPRRNAAEL